MQYFEPAAGAHLVQYSAAVSATVLREAIEIALRIKSDAAIRVGAIGEAGCEAVQNGLLPRRAHFPHRPVAARAAAVRGPIHVALVVPRRSSVRVAPMRWARDKAVQLAELSRAVIPVQRSFIRRAASCGDAIQVAFLVNAHGSEVG